MTQGLTREQLGVTEAMIEAYGDVIFRLSNNHQIRRGDPIRDLDFAAIEAHRAELGMGDGQIAERIGLTPQQVTLIRNLEERRRFHTGHYHMLNKLGGGKRWRAERMTPFQDHFRYSDDALSLRSTFTFDPQRVRNYVEADLWRGDTLASWLTRNAEECPDTAALLDVDGSVSWADLDARVGKLKGGLYAHGIRPGDVVAVMLPNTRAYVELFLAISALGAVMTTLYMTFRPAELSFQMGHSNAKMMIAPAEVGDFHPAAWAVGARGELPKLNTVVATGGDVPGTVPLEALTESSTTMPPDWTPPTAADPFLLLYTSGTTSNPKGVPLNSHQMLTNARVGIGEHDISEGDVVMSAAPFGHLYALYSVQMALAAKATTALLPMFTPPGLAEAVNALCPTHLFAGPAHLAACLGNGLIDTMNMSTLRVVVLSGAAVPPDLVRAIEPKLPDGRVCQLWGMTELQAGMYSRLGDPIETVATSAGRPSPGTEARIAQPDGTELPIGDEGELQVRGASVFTGYFGNPDATSEAFTDDGWFRSGDVAFMDADGNITLSGRVKDVINRGGVKYNPQEIEQKIEAMQAVQQCAIAPVEDARLGERACCYVVAAPGATVTLDEICEHLLALGVAKYKLPEQLELRGNMPMTATRKIIKGRLT